MSLSLAGLLAHHSKKAHLIRADTESGWGVGGGGNGGGLFSIAASSVARSVSALAPGHRQTHPQGDAVFFMVAIFTLGPILATFCRCTYCSLFLVGFFLSVLFMQASCTEHTCSFPSTLCLTLIQISIHTWSCTVLYTVSLL